MDNNFIIIILLVVMGLILLLWCQCSKKEGWIAGQDAILEPCYTQCMAEAKANYPVWLSGPANYSNYVTDPICRKKCCKECNNNP